MALTTSERLAVLETQVYELKKDVSDINDKLDQLIAIRHKGAGALWVVTTLLGVGVLGMLNSIFHFFKPG